MKKYAVAPIHTSGVAVRHVGPRDATWVPLSILTWLRSNLFLLARSLRASLNWAYLAKASFSSQTVPRFSSAHMTRTR
jgi:hypothetical protein